tara:strand:- start:126 stop:452 length:327 start_codon:yes stop_codon:yes gene_type:complete
MKTFTLATSKTLFVTVKFENGNFSFTRHYTPTLPEVHTVKAFSGKGGTGGNYSIWQAATKKGVLSDLKALGTKQVIMIKFINWMDDQTDNRTKIQCKMDLKAMFATMR